MAHVADRVLARALPWVPQRIVAAVARRYIAGTTLEEAMGVVEKLAAQNMRATLDILGEHVETAVEAQRVAQAYVAAVRALAQRELPAGVSVKLTHIGLGIDPALAEAGLRRIAQAARDVGRFVRVDMEDSRWTSKTLALVAALRKAGFDNVGCVIQAYLFRSEADVEQIVRTGGDVRVCKGIYREPPDIAYQFRPLIRDAFMRLAGRLLLCDVPVAIATHDLELIDRVCEFVEQEHIDRSLFEFQALLGVPVEATLRRLVARGYRVRVYVPYGPNWYAYSVRRLQENPRMAGEIARNLLRRQR